MAEPADLAGIYLKGVQTRAQIQEANQRLAVQQQEIAMRAQQESQARAIQAQQFQQEHQVAQQRIQVEQAYKQQEIDLRKQDLAEAAKMNEQKTQAAARQFEARQMWEKGMAAIQDDPSLSATEKANRQAQLAIRSGMSGNLPAETTSAVLRYAESQKPTVPASVTNTGDFTQITQPNGTVVLHPNPKAAAEKDPMVKVMLPDQLTPVSMARSQARKMIPGLPEKYRDNAMNKAAMSGADAGKFEKGKRARQNGLVYEFDGEDWNPVGE